MVEQMVPTLDVGCLPPWCDKAADKRSVKKEGRVDFGHSLRVQSISVGSAWRTGA